MKKLKKKLLKLSSLTLISVMLLNTFLPMMTVFADGIMTLTFTVAEEEGYTFETDGHMIQVVDSQYQMPEECSNPNHDQNLLCGPVFLGIDKGEGGGVPQNDMTAECSNDKTCTVTLPTQGVRISTPGNRTFDVYKSGKKYSGAYTTISENTTFEIRRMEPQYNFTGKTTLIWECNNQEYGKTCMHEFTLPTNTTNMNYIDLATVTDDTHNDEVFNIGAANQNQDKAGFVINEALEAWEAKYKQVNSVETVDYTQIESEYILRGTLQQKLDTLVQAGTCEYGPGDMECVEANEAITLLDRGLKLQPIGEPMSPNSYVSYGDNQFKITIYDAEHYAGLTKTETAGAKTYVKNEFETASSDSIDISNSTQEHPAFVSTILLNNKVTISSNGLAGVTFSSVETLEEVSENAISIEKNGNNFIITFNSNFYDRTIFKITDTNNRTYYIRIIRTTLTGDLKGPDEIMQKDNAYLESYFYFDSATSWDDYDVTATIIYRNGNKRIETLSNLGKVDVGGGNVVDVNETSAGENLKVAVFYLDFDGDNPGITEEGLDGIYFNVTYKGSTDDEYMGTFAGNGRGIYYDAEHHGIDYNK